MEDSIKELSAQDEAVKWLSSLLSIGDFFLVLTRYEIDNYE